MMKICTKVGEGVYGEVFRTQNSGQSVALKVSVSVKFVIIPPANKVWGVYRFHPVCLSA